MSRIIKLAVFIFFFPAALGVALGYSLVNFLEIPDVKDLSHYAPRSATRLYADDGALFAELFVEKRVPIPLSEMPDHVRNAFIAIEDVRFYQHYGFDLRGIGRAVYKNVLREGLSEGASTITQQLARNLFLTPTKSLKRKIEEIILAVNIERNYSKDEILNMYLNLIYLGEGAYGVEAASHTYFDKKTKNLSLAEAATLAGLTKSPSRSSPFKNEAKTLERRNLVLKKMWEGGFYQPGPVRGSGERAACPRSFPDTREQDGVLYRADQTGARRVSPPAGGHPHDGPERAYHHKPEDDRIRL